MVQTKRKASSAGDGELKFKLPDLKPLSKKVELDDAHKEVVRQNRGLLVGEESMRQFTRRIAYNNFDLYFRVCALNSRDDVINKWLSSQDIKPKSLKTTRVAKRFARSVWPDDRDGQRSSDEAKVLEAAQRYFGAQMPGKLPTLNQFLGWVEECGGLNAIRRGHIPVELGGKPSNTQPPPSRQEVFSTRKTQAQAAPSFGKLPFAPEGALQNELVILYGVVEEDGVSIRLACRVSDEDATKNVHNLKTCRFMHEGQPVVPHDMGEQVTMVGDESARTADEVIDQAAAQAV